MKNIKNKIEHVIVMLFSLGALISYAQPVIKVPKLCEVVVAGTGIGSSTGFGGIVGDGGIVIMPDPFDIRSDEGNFYYVANDTQLLQWNLLGDLSMQTETSYNEVLQPTGAINPLNIQSYNKNLRLAENPSATQPLLDPKWARSKGRITVLYYNKECNAIITFQILKRYENKSDEQTQSVVPLILGSDCVLPNTTYTYSVDQIASDNANDEIGFDKYYWSGLPEGSSLLYNSGDNSSITFITGASVSSFTLQCCYGRANAWDGDSASPSHTTCVRKSVGGQLSAPNYNTAPPTCHPIGSSSFTIEYNNPTSGNYTFTTPIAGWTVGAPVVGATTTIVMVTTPNNNSGQLTLTITGGTCNPAIFNYQINRSITTSLTIIPTGATTSCIASTSSGNTFTLSPTTSNSIEWYTEPASVTGVTLQNQNTAIVMVNTSGASGAFMLRARSSNASCNTSFVEIPINVRLVAPAFTASTPSCVVRSPSAITTIAVTTVTGATSYDWTPLPAGVSCTNCISANPSFVFNSPTNVNSIVLTVKAISANGCASNPTSKTINYITVATNFTGGAFNDQYAVSGLCGPVTSWTLSTASGATTYTATSGNITITGTNNNNLQISGTTGLMLISVCANLANGITVCANMTGVTNTQRPVSPSIKGITISPNPNNGIFFINVDSFKASAAATLYDITGKEIAAYNLRKGENKIEKENLAAGTYVVKLAIDGTTESRQIIIK